MRLFEIPGSAFSVCSTYPCLGIHSRIFIAGIKNCFVVFASIFKMLKIVNISEKFTKRFSLKMRIIIDVKVRENVLSEFNNFKKVTDQKQQSIR